MANTIRWTRLKLLASALLMLAASAPFKAALAEEADSAVQPNAAVNSAEPSQSNAEKPDQPSTKAAKPPEEFTPSEEISEDFAVSFPVDI